jgi:hypothetical protein
MSQNRRPMRVTGLFLAMMLESVRIVSEHDKTSTYKRGMPQPHPELEVRMAAEFIQFRFPKRKRYEDG